ncbi:hypothetical protein LC087_15855 [Bacillus carboniphilus]|uniref:Uncharacterized protein n=1 Tax=Bacillus carboniphilus TaxID=86663 RepID=A0ABY9JWZ6_9BACI|nr:hypothetical protein [Bacillus carboniphilus]WLR42196.1 hypothetical protein LC087_15855 [Bacillus carboniphilus]
MSEMTSGVFGTGAGEEYTAKRTERGTYLPVWVDVKDLISFDVRPSEVTLKLQSLFG